MFIAGNTYPQSLEDIQQAAPAFIVGGTPSLAPHSSWKAKTETIFDNSGSDRGTIIEASETIPGSIQITIPEDIIAIASVRLDGIGYAIANSSTDKRIGYYSFNPQTHLLTVYYKLPYLGGQVYWQGISRNLPVGIALINCVDPPYSEILKEWNIERVSINRSLEDSPSASFSFSACSDKETTVRSRFKPGQRVTLFNIPFRVTQLQIERKGTSIYPNYNISVTVSLEWYLSETFSDSPLNRSPTPQPLVTGQATDKKKIPSTTKKVDIFTVVATTGHLKGGNSSAPSPSQAGRGVVAKSSVALVREVETSGPPAVVDTPNYSSVSDALSAGAAKSGAFLYRSGEAVSTIKWGQVPTHFISPGEIQSDLSFNFALPDSNDSDDGEDEEEEDTEEEDTEEEEETPQSPARDDEEIVETTRTEFENTDNFADLTQPYYTDSEAARSPNICFDTGGATKKVRIIKERGGSLLEQTEETWGYVFISKDVHAFYPDNTPPEINYIGSGQARWQKVSETRTTNYFDELGYLVKTETTGYKLARAKQESDSLETCGLYIEALTFGTDTEDGQRSLKEIESYEFNQEMPIYDRTTYTLEKMRDYYRDIVRSSDIDWIEPKFCSRMLRWQIDRILIPNSQTDEDGIVRPPIVQVNELIEETRTIITNTKCTPERFKVNQYSRGAEGNGGRDRVVVTSSIENLGRPSTHTTIPIKQIRWQDLIKKPEVEEDDKTKEEKEKQEQKQIEVTQKTIASSRNETSSFSMKYHSEFKEGDKVYFDGRTWVILEISSVFNCVLGQVNCESFNLTLGKYNEIAININPNQFTNISLIGVTNG